ncbi:MurR/RpiR family transcriptional regulator [Salinicoccus albus]|uniref:MurR/RpiR family transcriptional regulator n=1 Tax=Salinicoccus albus TaxID=418756 RepID=UPI0003A6E402|nr:MurR/RpiR family transcriptional regulator [Salinicoccus albus]
MAEDTVTKKILDHKDHLPKKQKIFCEFILENYREISLDSIAVLAEKSGVGTTTVMRTINNLGYSNLRTFKRELHREVIESQTPKFWNFDDGRQAPDSKRVRDTWDKVNMLQKHSMTEDLEHGIINAVELMRNASKIHVFGLRTSRSVALFFENSFNQFYPHVNQLSYEPHFVFDRLYHAAEGEVIVLIALSPYTEMTYEVARYCHQNHIDIILIADSADNTMIPYAKETLMIKRTDEHYTMVPAVSLVETVTVLFGSKVDVDSQKILRDVGGLLARKNITRT